MTGEVVYTEESVVEAKKLILPTTSMHAPFSQMKGDINWQKAFKWYNKFIHKGAFPMAMHCRPCYIKVFISLKRAQSES